MTSKKYNKLVRDNIIDIIRSNGKEAAFHHVSGEEYRKYLILKLREEVEEFLEARTVEELADIKEVLDALGALPVYSDVAEVQGEKARNNGGFALGIVLDEVVED